jgi:hypothetical protein
MLRPRLGYAARMIESLSIGCMLPTSGAAAAPAAPGALAQPTKELGFDSVYISDHVVVRQYIRIDRVWPPIGHASAIECGDD